MKTNMLNRFQFKFLLASMFLTGSLVSFNVHAAYVYQQPRVNLNPSCLVGAMNNDAGRLFGSANAAASAGANCWIATITTDIYVQTWTVLGVSAISDDSVTSIWAVHLHVITDFGNPNSIDGDQTLDQYLYVYKRDIPEEPIPPISRGDSPQGEYPRCDNQPSGKTKNPIHIIFGNKYKHFVDYSTKTVSALTFERYYNSYDPRINTLGNNWRHNFERSIVSSYEGKSLLSIVRME